MTALTETRYSSGWPLARVTSKLTKEEPMFRKFRNRARQAVKGRIEINLDGFELGLSPEEVIADLDFGVGPIAETARSASEDRPQVGRVA